MNIIGGDLCLCFINRNFFYRKNFFGLFFQYVLFSIAINFPAQAQLKCKGPDFCSIKSFNQTGLTVICNSVSGVYGYRARVKAINDSSWQYFMMNAPDTVILIPQLKTTKTYVVQMGTLCTYSISDTSAFSKPDTAFAFCPCELPAHFWAEKTDSTSVILKWSPTFDARRFKVFYSNTPEGDKKIWKTEMVEASFNPTCTLSHLTPDSNYEISIRAICADHRRINSILFSPSLKIKTLKP
jgi:hypothetical protein